MPAAKTGIGRRLRFSYEEINFNVNSPAGDDRLVGAAAALVEADKADGRELVERAQHVLLDAAGEDGELADGFWMTLRNQT